MLLHPNGLVAIFTSLARLQEHTLEYCCYKNRTYTRTQKIIPEYL